MAHLRSTLDTQRDTGGTSCLCSLLISSKFLHTFWNLTDMDQQEEDQEEDVLKNGGTFWGEVIQVGDKF